MKQGNLSFDPIIPFLFLALQDGVFTDVKSANQLRVPAEVVKEEWGGRLELRIEPAKTSLRVMRRMQRDNGVWRPHPDEPESYHAFTSKLKEAGFRADFIFPLQFGTIRRMSMKLALGEGFWNDSQRRLAFGHLLTSQVAEVCLCSSSQLIIAEGGLLNVDVGRCAGKSYGRCSTRRR